jgi:hypothetical protein
MITINNVTNNAIYNATSGKAYGYGYDPTSGWGKSNVSWNSYGYNYQAGYGYDAYNESVNEALGGEVEIGFTVDTTISSGPTKDDSFNINAGIAGLESGSIKFTYYSPTEDTFTIKGHTSSSGGNNNGGSSGTGTFSGGGGGSSSFWSITKDVADTDFVTGYTSILSQRQQLSVHVSGETHHIGIVSLYKDHALINISSDPQQIMLYAGQDAKLDVNNDAYYDVYVKLNSIDQNVMTANLTIKNIYEKMPTTQNPPAVIETPIEPTNPVQPTFCSEGSKRCLSGELQQCANEAWVTMELCTNGCDSGSLSCITIEPSKDQTNLTLVVILVVLLLLAALAVMISRRKNNTPRIGNSPQQDHKALLHSKSSELESRISKLEKKGENMLNFRLILEEIKQDISSGLHYIAEGRLESLTKEVEFVEMM